MTHTAYQRVDAEQLREQAIDAASHPTELAQVAVRWLVLPLSIILCLVQSVVTLVASNVAKIIITSTMIPVASFAVLFLLVLAANPLLRAGRLKSLGIAASVLLVAGLCGLWWSLTWTEEASSFWVVLAEIIGLVGVTALAFALLRLVGVRPFNRAELTCVFAAMMVTAGVSTFGLTEQLIPLVATPHNPEWNTPQRGWSDPLILRMRPELYISDAKAIQVFREGVTQDERGNKLAPPRATDSWKTTVGHWWTVARLVPWSAWIGPLGCWMIFVAGAYALFYFLTYIVMGYWSDREKLIFPLAKLPESLLPDEGDSRQAGDAGRVPALLRTPGFWAGFALSFLVLSWNGMVSAGWIAGGLSAIPLGMGDKAFASLVSNGALEGLSGGEMPVMFLIIFTAIGISFLLPLEISFSAWFYFLMGKGLILLHVWMGYGRNGADYPSDWLWLNNPITALGGGGLFLFSGVALFRCLKDYFHLVTGRGLMDRVRLTLPVLGLAAGMIVVTLWLSWNRVGLGWAGLFTVVLVLLTVGLMRIVAEGGIYWFQSHISFFHTYRMLGLGKFLSAPVLAPLIPIYSVLFLDVKTFLAPNLLNGAKIHKDVGGGRFKFHANIILCLIASVVVSLGFAVFLAHLRGAQQMEEWFYSTGPMTMMDIARDASKATAAFNPVNTAWWGLGAAWVALSMYLRTTLFWFPHPIGFIMLINPLMGQLWFSFFIGWLFKKVTVKYGGKATFDKARGVFIGLIMGELSAIFAFAVISLISGIKIGGLTLNRYS